MAIKESGNAVPRALSSTTTKSKGGTALNKHCYTGTCTGKLFSGSNARTHLKKHQEEEKKMEKCNGD